MTTSKKIYNKKLINLMKIEQIKKLIEIQFVEDYDDLHTFMININDTLTNLNINKKYTYNAFCIDIEKNIIDFFILDKTLIEITPKMMSEALNKMIMNKILSDDDYEEKLNRYFLNLEKK